MDITLMNRLTRFYLCSMVNGITLPAVSTIDLLENELPGFIIVGVESQGMELRPVEGQQTPLSQHLEKEVVPHVNKKYSVAPYRILSGHSNSGRFVLDRWLARWQTIFIILCLQSLVGGWVYR